MRAAVLITAALLLADRSASAAVIDSSSCNAEQVLIRLEENYRRQGPVMLTFHQRTVSAVFGDERTQEGKVWLDPPGRFRVEVGGETFVCRADTLWHYVPAHRQVTVRALDSGATAGLPADLLWDLREDFLPVDCRWDTVAGKSCQRVRAVARVSSAAIQRLVVWVDPRSGGVEQAEYIDYNDDRVHLRFSPVKKDRAEAGRRYLLEVPDSVEVVMLPAKGRQQSPATPR